MHGFGDDNKYGVNIDGDVNDEDDDDYDIDNEGEDIVYGKLLHVSLILKLLSTK